MFGQTAFFSELRGPGGIVAATEELPEQALFVLLDQYPLAAITSGVAVVVIATFFITSSDSGSLVDDIHASGGSLVPKRSTRVFWALAEGAVAATLLAIGGQQGLEALQQASIASGIPLAVLLLGACWALVRAFRREDAEGYPPPGTTTEESRLAEQSESSEESEASQEREESAQSAARRS